MLKHEREDGAQEVECRLAAMATCKAVPASPLYAGRQISCRPICTCTPLAVASGGAQPLAAPPLASGLAQRVAMFVHISQAQCLVVHPFAWLRNLLQT